MSIQALDLLCTVGFLDNKDKIVDLNKIPLATLQGMINYYAKERRNRISNELQEQSTPAGISALISSISARTAVLPLLPSCLVNKHIYINDPLFGLENGDDENYEAFSKLMGAEKKALSINMVNNALYLFSEFAPLIRSNMLSIIPVKDLHHTPKEIPIRYSEDWFRSQVPEAIHDFVHKNVIIQKLLPAPDGKGLLIHAEYPKDPCRGIVVSFKNDLPAHCNMMYTLSPTRFTKTLSENVFSFEQTLPWNDPPSESQYRAWLYQSTNQTISARLKMIAREIALAEFLGCSYQTESEFEAKLCSMIGTKSDRPTVSGNAVNFLRSNEPRLKLDNVETVYRLRTDNPKLFSQFHLSLLDISRQLQGVDDFENKAKELLEKEIVPQVRDIEGVAKKMAIQAVSSTLETAGAIGLALLGGQYLPLASVLGLGTVISTAKTLPTVSEYLSSRKTPAFIWKQIIKT